ncbi:MAG: VOC family protein [Chloroflexota bacterium]|nr:MAG: glyoxalase [Chloroflexota bacterium]
MHRSRLGSIGIDCNDLDTGVFFWSATLGMDVADRSERYADLEGDVGGLRIFLQHVPEPKACKTRVHLDIESDDVEAEVNRLVDLGARTREKIHTWWVMEDPSGNEFCVVQPETPGFPERTRTWSTLRHE